jgi:deoxyribodipyrimidine photo-lyase
MSDKTILVWFRNDLRIHDNEILLEATRRGDFVLPVYCFDPYYFTTNASGNHKTGNFRARFLIQSVADLRDSLRKLGSELIVRIGNPAEVLPQLCEEYGVSEVYHHREVANEETKRSEEVEAALWKIKINLKHFIGHTLYHKEDLPFPIKDIPDSFSTFKKKVERDSNVRPCLPTPEQVKSPEITDAGDIPSLADLGLDEPVDDARAKTKFVGGETTGMAQLDNYFINIQLETPSKTKGTEHTKLSPWLALGCLSPRQVYWSAMKHGDRTTETIILELLWRDYFRFMFKKHGLTSYQPEAKTDSAAQDAAFELWKSGSTGIPFVDASMHKLNATGYISNYSRQVTAGYLVHNLEVSWIKGADYFEEKLIDYSPASNRGNWAYIAGMANDPRDNKYFNAAKQASNAEINGTFIDTWLSLKHFVG